MAGPESASSTAQDTALDIADDLFKSANLPQAELAYRRAIERAPHLLAAYFGAAACARHQARWDDCLAYLQAASDIAPDNIWPPLLIAADLLRSGRLDEAEGAYRAIALNDPHNVHAWLGLGHCARARANHHAALSCFLAGTLAAPTDIRPLLEAAAALRELGQIDAAEQRLQQVLLLSPGNLYAWFGLGHCARRRGDRQAAHAFFELARVSEPQNMWAHLEAAADLRELGRHAEARERLQNVIEIAPDNVFAHLGLGQCARASGNRQASLIHFQNALAAAPDNLWAQLETAADLRELGHIDAAQQGFIASLSIAPDNIHAHLGLGKCARSRGDHEAALAAFEKARDAAPALAAFRVELAMEQRALGRFAESDQSLAQALALDPRNVEAIIALADRALAASDAQEAHRIYRQASEEQPGQIWLRLGAVETLAALGQSDAALAEIAVLVTEFGPLPDIHLKWLNILRQSGDYPEAVRLGRTMIQQHPQHFWLRVELFAAENLVGSEADITACLARAPARGTEEQAVLERLHGNAAEAGWQTQTAIGHYEAAAALNPQDKWTQYDLVRAKLLLFDLAGARRHMRQFCALTADTAKRHGKPLNISQTHYGEMINDYSTDAPLLDQLVALQTLPPRARVPQLVPIVRHHPDSTAAAVALMIALRQSGRLSAPARPAPPATRAIPKTIVQFWDCPPPPEDVARLMRHWRTQNPDYHYQCFSDAMARAFLRARYPAPVTQAYLRARQPAQKADIFRLAWLASQGGIYADADDRCLAPLSTIIPQTAELVLYQEDHATLCNNFIAVVPGHRVMRHALRAAVNAINQGTGETVWFVTGPALLTRSFTRILVEVGLENAALPPGILVLDRRQMFSAVAMNCSPGYKRTKLHWNHAA